jgi:RecA DNA recombination protein
MRAAIEALLREKKLDVTLADVGATGSFGTRAEGIASTGWRPLDEALGGGLRRGHLSDVVGAPSSGRTTVVVRALAAATADRGEAAALVDACDTFDPASADAHGVHLPRLLWVRGDGDASRALKAFSLILQAGGFGLVVLDLADASAVALRRFPWTTWMRLARIIEGSETAAVVVGAERLARSAGGATIVLEGAAVEWRGGTHRARVFTGLNPTSRVIGVR